MKQDLIVSGVGGQGILSIAFVIDHSALKEGLLFKQAEVHGMAQRGGAVQSHLRLSDREIYSDLIPKGKADLILSIEPLESIRYIDYLKPDGIIVTSNTPLINILDYPQLNDILEEIKLGGRSIIIDSKKIALEAGSGRSQNIVMLGAASPNLICSPDHLKESIEILFKSKGKPVIDINLKAFDLGREEASRQVEALNGH